MMNQIIRASLPNSSFHIGLSTKKNNKGTVADNHFHNEIELLKVIRGKMLCDVNGDSYEISEGETVFINSLVPHQTCTLVDNTNCILMQIDADEFLDNHVNKYLSRYVHSGEDQMFHFKFNSPQAEEISGYIDNMVEKYLEKGPAYDIYIKASIYNILAFLYANSLLFRADNFFNDKAIKKILPVLKYIDANYQEQITLDTISHLLNINQQYFCRMFKTATNITFTEYLNFVRVCNAERLLSSTKKSIEQISLETGFSSAAYFNRTFKKFKNCSPTSFKKIKFARL